MTITENDKKSEIMLTRISKNVKLENVCKLCS